MINWEKLDTEQLKDQWERLERWTDWLRATYSVVKLPDCWPRHPDIVAELVAFRARWTDIYDAPEGEGDPNDAIHWHEALYGARERWREIGKSCFGGECSLNAEGVVLKAERAATHRYVEEVLGAINQEARRD